MIEMAVKQTTIYKKLEKTCNDYHMESCRKEERIRKLKKHIKELEKEIEELKEKIIKGE